MIAATVWTITGSPGLVDEIPATPFVAPPTPAPTPVIISVDEGEGVQEIGDMLEDEGVIESAIQFRVLVELLGYDRLLQAGEYELDPNTPALDVVYRMRRGIVSSLFVTVIEGWRLEEIADALDEQGVISREDFLEVAVAGSTLLMIMFIITRLGYVLTLWNSASLVWLRRRLRWVDEPVSAEN